MNQETIHKEKGRKIFFSIIVPTYNEEKDVLHTLNALQQLEGNDYEVVIVDDGSIDNTVPIVSNFIAYKPHFRLLRQPQNRGVSSARNRGIMEAEGKVVVILNADVLLPPHFLQQIKPHYESGNHWVGVYCRAVNQDSSFSRFTDAVATYTYQIKRQHWVWSEGFSCTKEAAIAVGLFPEDMPGCSGEDVDFGLNMEKHFKGVKDTSIVVPHIAPDTFRDYFNQNRGRGQGRTNVYYFMRKQTTQMLFFNTILASLKRIGQMVFMFPLVSEAWIVTKCSKNGRKDFFPFVVAYYVAEAAQLYGMWRAFGKISSNRH